MKKVLLLCQQRGCPIDLSPARYQLFHELKNVGYEMYVLIPERISNTKIRGDIDHTVNTKGMRTKDIRSKIRAVEPDFVIAFTYEDALILYRLPNIMKTTVFIYFNLEIYTPRFETLTAGKDLLFRFRFLLKYLCNKVKEILFVRQCKLFVIQDSLRKRTCKKYLIAHPNTLLIPNSYVYNEEDQVDVGCDRIVYSGGFTKSHAKSLIENLEQLSNIPLTFAGWSDDYFKRRYDEIRKSCPNINVYQQKLPPEQLSSFLRQYAVGLIWYTSSKDENVYNIGLASGKFFKHLSLGQPVISIECPGVSNVIKKYRLGIVINNVSDLKQAYEHIMSHYSYYQNNVIRIYKKKFDYKKVIQPFIHELEMMTGMMENGSMDYFISRKNRKKRKRIWSFGE